MKLKAQAQNVDHIEVTIEVTMRLSDWLELREALPEQFPHYHLSQAIRMAASNLNEKYTETIEIT